VCILSWHMHRIYSTPANPTIGNNNKNFDACCVKLYGATTTASWVNPWCILSCHMHKIYSTPANPTI
jgi:hypothetical protein